jgi:hypothetical protein
MNYSEALRRLQRHKDYILIDHNHGARADSLLEALDIAISLFKTKVNLCDACKKLEDFPLCMPVGDKITFGDGIGNDNIIKCTNYLSED